MHKVFSRGYDAPSAAYVNRRFTDRIADKNNIKTIIEAGSRDLIDALELENIYPEAAIFSFECNPENVKLCNHNLQFSKKIIFTDIALSDQDGSIDFFSLDSNTCHEHDPGVSSTFEHTNTSNVPMKKITVSSLRADTFLKNKNIENVDMLCLDLQGGELNLLKGLGKYIDTVKYIILEFDGFAYKNAPSDGDILNFLYKNNFHCLHSEGSDKLFKKNEN